MFSSSFFLFGFFLDYTFIQSFSVKKIIWDYNQIPHTARACVIFGLRVAAGELYNGSNAVARGDCSNPDEIIMKQFTDMIDI